MYDTFTLTTLAERGEVWVYSGCAIRPWACSRSSPINRGQLWQHRIENAHLVKYRHAPRHLVDSGWYRYPRTQNERRQVAAATVDERAPQVRGRRNATGLPTAWDDQWIEMQRSWKQKKVKKQWMANVR